MTSRGEQRWLPCMQRTVVNMAEIESEPVTMAEGSTAEGSTSEEEESDHSSSYLSLHCSSSPFEGDGSASDVGTDDGSDGEDDSQRGVVPYLYEPERENGSEPESEASSEDESRYAERLLNTEW